MKKILILLFFLFLLLPQKAFAQVVINEFLPNGSQEWVEFYNKGDSSVDLVDYYFDDDNALVVDGQVQTGIPDPGSDPIKLSGVLQTSTTCYLDLTTYLNNDGDMPSLFLSNGNTVDSHTYTTTQMDKSFSRVPDGGDWQASQAPTKSSNKCVDLVSLPTPTLTPTPTPTKIPTPTKAPTPTKVPTSTTAPVPTATKTPTPTPTPKSPTPTPVKSSTTPKPTISIVPTSILGESTKSAESGLSETAKLAIEKNFNDDEKKVNPDSSSSSFPVIFIFLGIIFIAACIILVSWQFRKNKNLTENE